MSRTPTLIFIPGAWHKPSCYDKIINLLRDEHQLHCVAITLPSTTDNPEATFKDDVDVVRAAIVAETRHGRDVVVVAHSYGGMVGNSAIKGFTGSTSSTGPSASTRTIDTDTQMGGPIKSREGHVTALVLIASGFTFTGLSFMDPFLGIPPPSWRVDHDTGYAVLVADPRDFFYHDLPANEAQSHASQLVTQSLKSLFEGGEHAYAGWQDVPTWYLGTIEDRGLPVALQRMSVGMARGLGAVVHHREVQSSHSPFLSMPQEVVEVILDAVNAGTEPTPASQPPRTGELLPHAGQALVTRPDSRVVIPGVKLSVPRTWFRLGIPLVTGRVVGWGIAGFLGFRRLWRRR